MSKGKRYLAWILVIVLSLSMVACSKEEVAEEDPIVEEETPEEEPIEEVEEEVEEEEEKEPSFTFSDLPVAVYEIEGLGLDEDVSDGDYPLLKLTPGENKFTLFCMLGDEDGEYSVSKSKIHSQNGKWKAITYTCLDAAIDPPDGYSILTRQEDDKFAYDEDTYDGSFFSLVDPWWEWLRFAALTNDQGDTIYIIDLTLSNDNEDYDEIEEVLEGMENAFEVLGASDIEEIDIEEALAEYSIEVSEDEEVGEEDEAKEEEKKEDASANSSDKKNVDTASASTLKAEEPQHTHTFVGGDCSTPSKCSTCDKSSGQYGSHNWVTQTIHHDAAGHYGQRVTGSEQVVVGYNQSAATYICSNCGYSTTSYDDLDNHSWNAGHDAYTIKQGGSTPIYESRDIVESVWVEDSAAWDENINTCSICGARQ